MKLRLDFEVVCSNLMNLHLVSSLDVCLGELLLEEQRIVTQASMEHKAIVSTLNTIAYAAEERNKCHDMRAVQCYNCNAFGHIVRDCLRKYCNYCKK